MATFFHVSYRLFTLSSPLLIFIAAFAFLAPNNQVDGKSLETNLVDRCATAEEADTIDDFFPDKFVPQDPEGNDLLEITYHKTYKIVYNHFQNKSYVFYQCGTEPPTDVVADGIKYGHHGDYQMVLPVPHQGGVGITETPQIPPIELLGKRREIIGYFGNPIYISSPCLEYMMDVEKSVEILFDKNDPYNETKLEFFRTDFLSRNPEAIVLVGPYGAKDANRTLAIAASQERTAVATYDWIGLFGALFNLEAAANKLSQETNYRYQCSAQNAAVLSADKSPFDKPTVLWARYIDGYNWSVAECPTWDAAYYCEYARHCGANLLSRPDGVGFSK